jgi:hypothetical protein
MSYRVKKSTSGLNPLENRDLPAMIDVFLVLCIQEKVLRAILRRKPGPKTNLRGEQMKILWSSLVAVGLLSAAVSQTASTSTSGSATGSVSPGQASAGANASQNAQAPGVSAGTAASGNAQISHEQNGKQESGSGKHASASGSAVGSAGASGNSLLLSEGSTMHTELTKSLDAKKAKPGDQVTAKVTEDVKSNNQVIVRKGSKVVGHVTEAQARGKEHADSTLGIAFDKVVTSGGEEMQFNGVIQAIAPPAQALAAGSVDQSADIAGAGGGGHMPSGGGGRSGGGLGGVAGGAVSSVGATAGGVTNTVGSAGAGLGSTVGAATGGLSAQGTLTSASRGVVGLQGLALNSSSVGNAQGSLITSPTQNVKLDSGTQVLLRAAGSAQ